MVVVVEVVMVLVPVAVVVTGDESLPRRLRRRETVHENQSKLPHK